MSGNRLISKLLFGGVVLIAIGISIFGYLTFEESIDAMRRASQENISWSATQLERELTRFRDSLDSTTTGTSSTAVDINERFDVLWSRVAVFQRGEVGQRLRVYDTENVVGRLFETLQQQEIAVVRIKNYDFDTMANISRAFFPFGNELHTLSRRITLGEEEKRAEIRAQMRDSSDYTFYASILTVIMVTAALMYFAYESQQFKKLANENKLLADKFKLASEAKSRFLTMMSHELRTPMNGVLGLLAVARETETNPTKKELLDQADRSANRMLGMLTDILDFAALEEATLRVENKPFFSHELLLALPEHLEPVAMQTSARLRVRPTGHLPMMLCGDAPRLRRSYALIVTYFLETAGAQDIEVKLSYEAGELRAGILVDYIGEGWSPTLVFGDRAENTNQFGAGALGPSVARAMVAKMNGKIEIVTHEGKAIELCICVPVKALAPTPLNILLDLHSASMQIICKSAVAGLPVAFHTAAQDIEIGAIWLEAGRETEAAQVEQLGRKHPNAKLFAIGRPLNPKAFDFVIDMPLESETLKNHICDLLR